MHPGKIPMSTNRAGHKTDERKKLRSRTEKDNAPRPTITLNGQPLLFTAVEGSAFAVDAHPISIAWRTNANGLHWSSLVCPAPMWVDKPWDSHRVARLGLTNERLRHNGNVASTVAVAAAAAIDGHCLVMQLPTLECVWLRELLMLQPRTPNFGAIGITDLAILLKREISIGEDRFIQLVIDDWFALLGQRLALDDWLLRASSLIDVILDDAVSRGRLVRGRTIALRRTEHVTPRHCVATYRT